MQARTRIIGRQVEFSLGDLSPCDRLHLLERIGGEASIEGRVVDYVELGEPPEKFAVMEVRGIKTPMLVPLSALQ